MGEKVQRIYTRADRENAAMHLSLSGNLRDTARRCNIPLTTMHDWSSGKSDKDGIFSEAFERCRTERSQEFIGRFEAIVEQATSLLSERLRDDPSSVSAKDLSVISGVALDKALTLQGRPSRITQSQGIQDLANTFRRLSSTHAALPDPVDTD
jgi:hypothetical protein